MNSLEVLVRWSAVTAVGNWVGGMVALQVDERAVLKHFEWPEQKADALREAAFGYRDLKKLEGEASSFRDDPRQPCAAALKKMQALFEKEGVFQLSCLFLSGGSGSHDQAKPPRSGLHLSMDLPLCLQATAVSLRKVLYC